MTETASGGPSGASAGTQRSDELLSRLTSPPQPAGLAEIHRRKKLSELALHQRIGNWALRLMIGQVAIADLSFYIYGFANDWHIPTAAITGWLAATVVQVVGVVLVITRSLFPLGGQE